MKVNFHWYSYPYLSYERNLARRELVALLGREPIFTGEGMSVECQSEWATAAYRTTYFREAVAEDGSKIIPLQASLEASTCGETQSPTRQKTRYSAHGLHEYRGKFNPQVVRAIANILQLKPGDWILDPFCGSGTTLLEAAHIGFNAIGVDFNPLGVLIAQAKIAAMQVPAAELYSQVEEIKQRLSQGFCNLSYNRAFSKAELEKIGGEDWQSRLPDVDYLHSWFAESVLVQLAVILDEIKQAPVLQAIFSDIVRQVSWQEPADLRMRRRKEAPDNAPAIPIFLEAVTRKVETILKARQYLGEVRTIQKALLGDARHCAEIARSHFQHPFDAAITSPPYATALPYIDTHRLSLVLLELIGADELRKTEKSLIGQREIAGKERAKLENAIACNSQQLPDECWRLCQQLKNAIDKNSDGFRKQNVPALLYKYLADMAKMFREIYNLLREGAPFALVVGYNKTQLGGQEFVIDTPHLLAILAEENGFAVQDAIALDTYQRFHLNKINSIRSETLLILKRK